MAEIRNHGLYQEDLSNIISRAIPWEQLKGKSILLTGATGLIGTMMTDVFLKRNIEFGQGIHLVAMGRSEAKARKRLSTCFRRDDFRFIEGDVNHGIPFQERTDYVIHAASNTHPMQYSMDPIGTIMTNIEGTKSVLEYARSVGTKRVVFLSSVEVYGENRGDTEYFDENYCGYIDCNTLRAGYPEGKRAGEALCQAYRKQYEMDIVIPRLSRTYGPTMSEGDSKAIAQFIKKAASREDIVLKSAGTQLYSYTYVADAVAGILCTMLLGKNGEAYNIADPASDIRMKDLAGVLAEEAGTKVVFEIPEETEKAGYSKATKALLDSNKLRGLGWRAEYTIEDGLRRTIEILRSVVAEKKTTD